KRLVAYLVARSGQTISTSDLRSDLSERLPAYMIPVAFVLVDGFPLTPNGKVDRAALLALKKVQHVKDTEAGEARTPMEELLAGIFYDLLDPRRDRALGLSVGRHQNFFELGGHSLLATRLIAKIRAILDVEVPLRAVFETPTVASLAKRVE